MIVVHFPSWFPDAERPLNGNFILRQIEAAGSVTESIVLHHSASEFDCPMPENVHFHPIHCKQKRQLIKSYITEFQTL